MSRGAIYDTGLLRPSRNGDANPWNPVITAVSADANDTVTIAKMLGGVIQYTGFTAGRTLTTDTAANILASAQFAGMDIGDTYAFYVSITVAFAGTWAAGTGVTLAGRATTPASSGTWVLVTKASATTVTITVL